LTRRACPRANGDGNPGVYELVSHLRGSDNHFLTYLQDTTIVTAKRSLFIFHKGIALPEGLDGWFSEWLAPTGVAFRIDLLFFVSCSGLLDKDMKTRPK
jgi:hypothetical protein